MKVEHALAARVEGVRLIYDRNRYADRRLVQEAVDLIDALVSTLRTPLGAIILDRLAHQSLVGVEMAMDEIWRGAAQRAGSSASLGEDTLSLELDDIERRLIEDQPWYEVMGPLATVLDRRVSWTWRLVRWLFAHDYLADRQHLKEEFETYGLRHDAPVRGDYVIELQLQSDDQALFRSYDTYGQLSIPLLLYRLTRPDDYADIVIRHWIDPGGGTPEWKPME